MAASHGNLRGMALNEFPDLQLMGWISCTEIGTDGICLNLITGRNDNLADLFQIQGAHLFALSIVSTTHKMDLLHEFLRTC